jgi:hypothetical protein
MSDDTRRTAAARLREEAQEVQASADNLRRICPDMRSVWLARQEKADALNAGADALDLVATQGAEIARLRTALERIVELNEHPRSCGLPHFGRCDCGIAIARAALALSEVR